MADVYWAGLLPSVDVLRQAKERIQLLPVPGKEGAKPLSIPPEARIPRPEQENMPANVPSPLRGEIEARYIARLEAICNYYEGKLNSLVGSAWNEYSTAPMQGQKISAVYLAGKYLVAGNALEKKCDREFYAVLSDFRSELRNHSLPLDKTYEVQREYNRAKAARKRQILSTASKFF